MSSEGSRYEDETKLRQCLQLMIDSISETINNQHTLNDLRNKLKNILEEFLTILSRQCRNYLLNILYQYEYDDYEKTLSNSFTKSMLNQFLHDLKGLLLSLDVFQKAWNGDQTTVENFIQTFPTFKDKSGLYQTTLLYSAARNNHMNLVKYLIEIGHCSINAQNKEYLFKDDEPTFKGTIDSTALHAACYQGHLNIVKYLIEHGGDYFISNILGETPVLNSESNPNLKRFFRNFLLSSYINESDDVPNRAILQEIDIKKKPKVDCIWEYKPLNLDQWYPFALDASIRLQETLNSEPFQDEIQLKTGRDTVTISMAKFLRKGKNNSDAWVRCRGSSLLNFYCYSQWQIIFIRHPNAETDSPLSLEIFHEITDRIQLQTWYNVDKHINLLFETAVNYRRKYLNINLNDRLIFDLQNFTFTNEENTIDGFLRWIPKIIMNTFDLTPIDNFQLPHDTQVKLLTIETTQQAYTSGYISEDEMKQYDLKYENAFHNNNSSFLDRDSLNGNEIRVVRGDLLAEKVDAIVVCTSSKYLVESVFLSGGKSVKHAFNTKVQPNQTNSIISVITDGELASKVVYFVPWKPNPNQNILCQTIKQLVIDVIDRAVNEHHNSIAFPAIGCGEYGCPISLVAQTIVQQVQKQIIKHPMTVLFVIQPDRTDIYDEFRRQVASKDKSSIQKSISSSVGKGTIDIVKGDITKQQADVIIGSSSSENLRQVLLQAGGDQVQQSYDKEYQNNPNSLVISTPSGHLHCKRIFFLKWDPDYDQDILRQSINDLIGNVIQNVQSHNFTSIAFPALGCGEHACSVDIVVKTMVKEMKTQMQKRKLPWTVKFIIHPSQQNVYDEFCKQLLQSDSTSIDFHVPSTWQESNDNTLLHIVPKQTEEYHSIISKFDEEMKGSYKTIVRLERIQNERWYMQYIAHSRDFIKRLNQDTEKRLYHGCPETAADLIIKDCFNRSFAGVNGVSYGFGVYFSKNATYSNGYALPNSKGERCIFVARVLVGKTTLGNSKMKTRPLGFDSTTDGNHIFVTYHDAQAYAEYLITYK